METLSPFEWASQHIQLLGWPTLVYFAAKFTWNTGRFLVKQELQVEADRTKLSEARDAAVELKQVNTALLEEWKSENGSLRHLVESMIALQNDFHMHVREDQLTSEAIMRNFADIKRTLEAAG